MLALPHVSYAGIPLTTPGGGGSSVLYRALGGLFDANSSDARSANQVRLVDFTTPSGGTSTIRRVFYANTAADSGKRIRAVITDTSGVVLGYSGDVTLTSDRLTELALVSPIENLPASTGYRVGINYESASTQRVSSVGSAFSATATFSSALPGSLTLSASSNPINCWALCEQAGTVTGTDFIAESGDGRAAARSFMDVNVPDDYAVGDIALLLMFAGFNAGGAGATIPTPSGWTLVSDSTYAGHRSLLFARRLDGTESPVIYMSQSGGTIDRMFLKTAIFRGMVASGSYYEAFAGNSGGSNTAPTGNAITTLGNNRLLVDTFHASNDSTLTPGSGWAKAVEELTLTGNDAALAITTKDAPTAGSQSAQSGTYDVAANWRVNSLALIRA